MVDIMSILFQGIINLWKNKLKKSQDGMEGYSLSFCLLRKMALHVQEIILADWKDILCEFKDLWIKHLKMEILLDPQEIFEEVIFSFLRIHFLFYFRILRLRKEK